ncbi:MAG: hypothetical protein ACP5VS_05585, partial [Desulfomonilaceae bacterium]
HCFINCHNYLKHEFKYDPKAFCMSITQNHLPSAGTSLIHTHFQVTADRVTSNRYRLLRKQRQRNIFVRRPVIVFRLIEA